MNVAEIMTKNVITVRPETSLKEVAQILAERDISGVPVVDSAGTLVGVVSEGDHGNSRLMSLASLRCVM